MTRKFFITGVIFATTAVMLGALGAHSLEKHLSPDGLLSFKTGVRYQMYHAFGLLFLGLLNRIYDHKIFNTVYWFFTLGTLFFSLSIYLLTTRPITHLDVNFLGPITPIGGILLITGWLVLLFTFIKRSDW